MTNEPDWLAEHRKFQPFDESHPPHYSQPWRIGGGEVPPSSPLLADVSFNNHARNDGKHVSPYDNGTVQIGTDALEVRLLQGVNLDSLKQVLARATRATTGLSAPPPPRTGLKGEELASMRYDVPDEDWQEMFGGGLQAALESQTIVFEVWGASRALTHQLVRSRRAGFHQQSQRATWFGDRPQVRMPESVWRSSSRVRYAWQQAYLEAWRAYKEACDAGVSYQDARYILPEGTTNYIQCEYTIREFIAVYAYRGCSMFLWEMVDCMRKMREAIVEQSPWLDAYVKVSCENGSGCPDCKGSGMLHADGVAATIEERNDFALNKLRYADLVPCEACQGTGGRKCTFQGWENVEGQCDRPQAKQSNRTFLPNPKFRIGAS